MTTSGTTYNVIPGTAQVTASGQATATIVASSVTEFQDSMIHDPYNGWVSTGEGVPMLDLSPTKDEIIQSQADIISKQAAMISKLTFRIGQLTGLKRYLGKRADRWKSKYRECDKKLSFDDEDEDGVLYGGLHDQQ